MSTATMDEIQLEHRATSMPDMARTFVVETDDQYTAAGEFLKAVKALRAEINETFDPVINKAHLAHKAALDAKKKVDAPLLEAEAILKPRIADYLNEVERRRLAEQVRLQKLADAEHAQRVLEEAAEIDACGETDEANRHLEEMIASAPTVVVQSTAPKVAGVSLQKRYSATVVDLMTLVKAVAEGRAPIQCLAADTVFLNRQAVAMRESLNYPGVKVSVTSSVTAARR